jgi:6-pyruvoyltetrahydropterin/6-carboxytetrahydropterin synthase
MHGHSYRVEIMVQGEIDYDYEWVVDFSRLDEVWKPIALRIDHQILNDVLPNPTAENLARWIWDQAEILLGRMLYRVTVWETEDARCEYEGS